MTTILQCDGPDYPVQLGPTAHHIALAVEGEEPGQALPIATNEDGEEIELLSYWSPGAFVPDRHFCSMACLATWAMRQHIDGGSNI